MGKKKCSHIFGLIALDEIAEVNDEKRRKFVIILGNSKNPDDVPDGDDDVLFPFCPLCGIKNY